MKKSGSSRKMKSTTIETAIKLTPEQQLAFRKELNKSPKLTPAQRRLGTIMRGES